MDVIYKTLRECHLEHDEGPDVGGPVGPYVQTERRPFYGKYAELLIARGHAYRCFCEKAESEEDSGDFERGDDPCRSLSPEEADRLVSLGKPFVIRQRIPHEGTTTFHDEIFGDITVENRELDDQVLIKRDGLPTYNFANVVDDHLMGITHVVRGSEYLSSAPKYDLLYRGFGWEVPKYVHCSPVMRDAHNKMSKRHGDPSYEDLIAQGFLTDAVINYVTLLGWSPKGEQEFFTMDELKACFDLSGISKSPAIFDIEKLRYFNSAYIRAMSPEDFAAVAAPWIRRAVKDERYDVAAIAALLQQRTEVLSEIPEKLDFFDALPAYSTEDGGQEREGHVAGAYRRGRKGRHARRRGGDLPHPRPGRDAAPSASCGGQAQKLKTEQKSRPRRRIFRRGFHILFKKTCRFIHDKVIFVRYDKAVKTREASFPLHDKRGNRHVRGRKRKHLFRTEGRKRIPLRRGL